MTQQQIGQALKVLFAQSSFPGAAIDQAMEIRAFIDHLASGKIIAVMADSAEVQTP